VCASDLAQFAKRIRRIDEAAQAQQWLIHPVTLSTAAAAGSSDGGELFHFPVTG
jgi:hypothetical protein